MKHTGNLKKKEYNAKTREEARSATEDAGMTLNDKELDKVSGGNDPEVGTQRFKYKPGDSVMVTTHPEYGWGTVKTNKSIVNGMCLDEVYFIRLNDSYDFFEDDLTGA